MKQTRTKQLVFAALCTALGVTLPIAFHSIPNAGSIFLPMHIPVLLCGFLGGWPYGLACGILAPVLSSLTTGMPPAAYLPSMVCELAVYGAATGFLSRKLHTGSPLAGLYLQLILAMLCGRAVSGVLNALIFQAGKYSLAVFLTGAFVKAFPGILIQLAVIPTLVRLLEKLHIVELPAPGEPAAR